MGAIELISREQSKWLKNGFLFRKLFGIDSKTMLGGVIMKKNYKSIDFFGLPIFGSDMSELLTLILPSSNKETTEKTQLVTVFTPNPEHIVEASQNPAFKKNLAQADFLIPDGIGLISAQKVMQAFGKSSDVFTQRITGIDLSEALLLEAHQRKWHVLVIGGRDYLRYTNHEYRVQKVDKAWLARFTERNPTGYSDIPDKPLIPDPGSLLPVYWLQGYQDVKNPTQEEEKHIIQTIKKIQPELVFVAFGAPAQEEWIVAHRKLLESSGTKIAMVVGGAFDVILGKLGRAPVLMQKLGLEWLFRLFQEPHRWKRQLKLLTFMKLVLQRIVS